MESLKEQHAIVAASVSGEDWWILKKGDVIMERMWSSSC